MRRSPDGRRRHLAHTGFIQMKGGAQMSLSSIFSQDHGGVVGVSREPPLGIMFRKRQLQNLY